MSSSQFLDNIECLHCGEHCTLQSWPVNGDAVPFYFELDTARFSVKVDCEDCGESWYVVWDSDPGPIESIGGQPAKVNMTNSEAMKFYHTLLATAEMGINSGIRDFEEFRSHVLDTIGGSMPMEALEALARKAWDQAWSKNR